MLFFSSPRYHLTDRQEEEEEFAASPTSSAEEIPLYPHLHPPQHMSHTCPSFTLLLIINCYPHRLLPLLVTGF